MLILINGEIILRQCKGAKPTTDTDDASENLCGTTVYVMHRSYIVKCSGALCIKYPGDSSMESCVNHDRRKNKVSCTMLINAGLVEPKSMHNLYNSMAYTVNIL